MSHVSWSSLRLRQGLWSWILGTRIYQHTSHSHGNQTLHSLSVLDPGWERVFCSFPMVANLCFVLAKSLGAQKHFPPILQKLKAVASSEGGSGKCVGCCANPTEDHCLHTCTTLGHAFQYPLLHQPFHVLLVKAPWQRISEELEILMCLRLPVILNWYLAHTWLVRIH